MKYIFYIALVVSLSQLTGCTSRNHNTASAETTLADSSAACLNEFNGLKQIAPETYQFYLSQFTELNKSYQVYKQNAGMMNKDAKEVLGMELDSKLKLICARVQSAAFQNMAKRAQDVNKL